jgi:hypothetical protein
VRVKDGGIVEITDGPIEGSRSLHVQWDGKECESRVAYTGFWRASDNMNAGPTPIFCSGKQALLD